MKLLNTLFCLGLWASLGLSLSFAQEASENSITTIPHVQDQVEESIEATPFTEEETDDTTIGTVIKEVPKTDSQTKPFLKQPKVPPEEQPQAVKATPYQKAIIDAILFGNAVRDLMEDGTVVRNELNQKYPDLMEVSITKLDNDYGKNQIKAEKIYKDKWLLIAGSVSTIRDNKNPEIGPTMILNELAKTDPSVETRFANQAKARKILGVLEDGQVTSVVCQADEYNGSDVKLKNCEFFHDLLLDLSAPKRAQMIEAVEGRGNKWANASTAFIVFMIEKVLGPEFEAKCEQGPEVCLIGFSALDSNSKKADEMFPEVLQEMHELGYIDEMLGDGSEVEKEIGTLFK